MSENILKTVRHDKWVLPFFKQYKKTMALALFLGVLTFICAGALMFSSGFLISKSATLPYNIMLIYVPIVLTRGFGIARPVFHYFERLMSHNWVLKMTSSLRLMLYNSLEKRAIFLKTKYKMGDILDLLSEDVAHIQNLYLRTIFPLIIAWVLYIVIIIILGFFSLWFALIMLLLMGIVVFVFPLVSLLVNGAKQFRRKQIKHELYANLTDNVLGISDWVISGRREDFLRNYRKTSEPYKSVDDSIHNFNEKNALALQLVLGIIVVAVILFSAHYFGYGSGQSANWIAASILCVFPLFDAFTPLSDAVQETNEYKSSIERLNSLNHADSDGEEASTPNNIFINPPLNIEIKDLSFKYEEESKDIFLDFNLNIDQSEKIAILGPSGSGKSTLLSLIRGDLTPDSGHVLLSGFPTKDLGDSISKYIGVINQNPYLFNTSILSNVRIGNPSASEDEVCEVLDKVGLTNMIKKLPDGLQTMSGEAGAFFSGGEAQRIALARVLLKDTPIIILDEPTVGLDPVTENAIINTFFKNLKDKTIIWVTHHLQGVSAMDRVIFMKDGQIKIDGKPEELEKDNAFYQKLLAMDRGY